MSLLLGYLATLGGVGGGGGGAVVALASRGCVDTNGGLASATYRLSSSGDVFIISTRFGIQDVGDWISPKSSAPGLYEVRADLASGSGPLTSGTLGSWVALSTSPSWTLTTSGIGISEATVDFQIRLGGTVLTSAQIAFYAEAF